MTFQVTWGFWNQIYINKKYFDKDNLTWYQSALSVHPYSQYAKTQCVHSQLKMLTLFSFGENGTMHQKRSLTAIFIQRDFSQRIPFISENVEFERLSQMFDVLSFVYFLAFCCTSAAFLSLEKRWHSSVSPCTLTHNCLCFSIHTPDSVAAVQTLHAFWKCSIITKSWIKKNKLTSSELWLSIYSQSSWITVRFHIF